MIFSKFKVSAYNQVVLFSLKIDPSYIQLTDNESRRQYIYYLHYNYNNEPELIECKEELKKIGIRNKILSKITNIETKYTAIILLYIPTKYIHYIRRGAGIAMSELVKKYNEDRKNKHK